jgi:branched-chain amino acid transport system permease protein
MVFYEIVREWIAVTGGTMGFRGVPSPMLRNLAIFGLPVDAVQYFRVLLVVTAVLMLLLRNITQSRIGRAFYAIHFSEIAAGSIGISRGQTRRQAYALSGALAGLAGAFYGHLVGYLGPESFALPRSIEVLVVAIVGGLGSIPGQILSSVVFTFLPEKLQVFSEYQYIVYGIILTFTLILLPKGIAGLLLAPPRFIRDRAIARAAAQNGPQDPGDCDGAAREPGSLRVEGVTVKFGGLTAVDNVSLDLKPGQITALIGPNGSGKSTLVNAISGVYRPTSGRIIFRGTDLTGWYDHQVARHGVVRTFQDPRLVPHFTVRENLLLGAHRLLKYSGLAAAFGLRSAVDEEAKFLAGANSVLKLTDLHAVADRTIDTLPYGYCRLAEVGRALIARPRAILLDEPAAGLSEIEMERLAKVIRDMKAMGLIILLIEHHMDFVAELVDDVVVLDSGRVIYRGDVAGMRRDPQVIAAYLGSEELAHA